MDRKQPLDPELEQLGAEPVPGSGFEDEEPDADAAAEDDK
jgi:hypothetical protein